VPAKTGKPGKWYRVKEDVHRERDPIQVLNDAIESHSIQWRQAPQRNIVKVLTPEERSDPKYLLAAFLDSREKAPTAQSAAKAIRSTLEAVGVYVKTLEAAGLASWDGNKIRKDRKNWNVGAAKEALRAATAVVARPSEPPGRRPVELEPRHFVSGPVREGPTARMVKEAAASGRPETVETMAEGLDTLQAELQDKSLLQIIRDYRVAIEENREMKARLAGYAKVAGMFEMLQKLSEAGGLEAVQKLTGGG
jgi:hypothetical protein